MPEMVSQSARPVNQPPSFPNPQVILYSDGKQGYKVFFDPLDTRIDIYFRLTATVKVFSDELDHVRCYTRYDEALETFKREVEAILACPAEARKLYKKAQERLREAERECKRCDYFYDRREWWNPKKRTNEKQGD